MASKKPAPLPWASPHSCEPGLRPGLEATAAAGGRAGGQASRKLEEVHTACVCLGFSGLVQALPLFWEPRLPLRGLEPPEEEAVSRGGVQGTSRKSRLQPATVAAWQPLLFALILFSCLLHFESNVVHCSW